MNNPHQNARTCFYSREQIVERYQNGEKVPSIAAAFGISVRTVYKWLKRFREHGPSGLIARSSAPKTCSNAYMAGWRTLIVRLRQLRLTADEIESLIGTKVIAKINVGQTARRLEEQFGNTIMITYRRDTDGGGRLKWVREEKREPVVHRTDFQTELGPLLHKRGVYVLVSGLGKHIYRVLVPYSKPKDLRAAERPAAWTTRLREIFYDDVALARQDDITAQEEMRFGEPAKDRDEGHGLG